MPAICLNAGRPTWRSQTLVAAKRGHTRIRFDLSWELVETVKGRYSWGQYDQAAQAARERGVKALFILDYRIPAFYGGDGTNAGPTTPEQRAGFAAFAAAAAARYVPKAPGLVEFEVWNEPNSKGFGAMSADAYAALVNATADAIRKGPKLSADARAVKLWAGALAYPFDPPTKEYAAAMVKAGNFGPDRATGLSLHPYLFGATIRQTIERVNAEYRPIVGPSLPINLTEIGQTDDSARLELYEPGAPGLIDAHPNLVDGDPAKTWAGWQCGRRWVDDPAGGQRAVEIAGSTGATDPPSLYLKGAWPAGIYTISAEAMAPADPVTLSMGFGTSGGWGWYALDRQWRRVGATLALTDPVDAFSRLAQFFAPVGSTYRIYRPRVERLAIAPAAFEAMRLQAREDEYRSVDALLAEYRPLIEDAYRYALYDTQNAAGQVSTWGELTLADVPKVELIQPVAVSSPAKF